jgi:DNA polymerase-3 subunit gamma/tau
VRDGALLLDQAIAHGAGTSRSTMCARMLGLADRTARVIDLFERGHEAGDVATALAELGASTTPAPTRAVVLDRPRRIHVHLVTRLKPRAGGGRGRP